MFPIAAVTVIAVGGVLMLTSPAAWRRKGAFAALLCIGTILTLLGVVMFTLPAVPGIVSASKQPKHISVPIPQEDRELVFVPLPQQSAATTGIPSTLNARPRPPALPTESLASVSPFPPVPLKPPAEAPRLGGMVPYMPMATWRDQQQQPQSTGDVNVQASRKMGDGGLGIIAQASSGMGGGGGGGGGGTGQGHPIPQPEPRYNPQWYFPAVPNMEGPMEEKARFDNLPETPEIDRKRRIGTLRELALTLKPESNGAVMIPISGPGGQQLLQ